MVCVLCVLMCVCVDPLSKATLLFLATRVETVRVEEINERCLMWGTGVNIAQSNAPVNKRVYMCIPFKVNLIFLLSLSNKHTTLFVCVLFRVWPPIFLFGTVALFCYIQEHSVSLLCTKQFSIFCFLICPMVHK